MLSQASPTNDANPTKQVLPKHAPNLIVVGAMKASTTTFYELITRHPNIWFSSEKEPHYFTSSNYGNPIQWQEYLRLFSAAPSSTKWIGEASTGYSKLPHFGNTPKRLQETLGQPRFIYLVRDPVQRTISNFQHSYMSGHFPKGTTLSEAVQSDPILLDASCYARQIRAYWEVFGTHSLLIIPTDQLHAEPDGVMGRVEKFLDLPAYDGWETTLPQSNAKQAVNQSLKIQSMVPKPLLSLLKKFLPKQAREQLKGIASKAPELPTITDADRMFVQEQIAEDLRDLTQLADENLSAWIARWPSVQQLGQR